MLFTTLGNAIKDVSHLASEGVGLAHHHTDALLDNTGASAFVPPACHEIGDGIFGVTQRGIKDVGSTSGNVIRSFE